MSKRVLLVDDDLDQLSIRSMLLASHGLDPCVAQDSVSALQMATREAFACAVVDLRLPTEAEGRTLIQGLKALDPKIRILVLTGQAATGAGAIDGVEAIFEKGMSSRRLLSLLGEICGNSTGL